MTKLILNNTNEFEILNFNRSTYLADGVLTSNASCSAINNADMIERLHNIMGQAITSFIIKQDNEVIYDAGEVNATIMNINEYLMEGHIDIGINIQF